jgi:hypothetical protein
MVSARLLYFSVSICPNTKSEGKNGEGNGEGNGGWEDGDEKNCGHYGNL